MTNSTDGFTARLDAADRLERVIDAQSTTLERIDTKSERIARLLGILLGVVLSSLSLGMQLQRPQLASLPLPTRLAFLFGVGFLALALAGAVVTLLSSRYKIGLGHDVGDLLSRSDYDVSTETHLRRVVGTYAYNVKLNYRIIEVNARRLRRTLVLLLLGLLYVSFSVIAIVSGTTETVAWPLFVSTVPIAGGTGWFVLSGRYLPIEEETIRND